MIAGFPEVLPPHEVAPGARTGNSMTAPRSACSALRERGGKQESQRLMGEASAGSDIEQPASPSAGSWADVLALPPMPTPDYCAMRGEACCGNSLVIFLIFLFVAPMHAYASSNPLTMTMKVWMFAIYAEAATAIICLLGLMWGDPGTVKRTPDTCFPQPEIVADRLRKGQDLRNVGNVTEDGRVFCIRCLVWRPETSDVHHCGTCQRCVEEFDHHCGVFGRCIAGDGFGGNMGYFKTLIMMGVLGCATCVSFMFVTGGGAQSNYHHTRSHYPIAQHAAGMGAGG